MGLFGLFGKKVMLQCTCGCGCREPFEKYSRRMMYHYAEWSIRDYKEKWKGDYEICIDCNLDRHTNSSNNQPAAKTRQKFSSQVEQNALKNQGDRCNNSDCRKPIGVVKGRMVYFEYDHIDGDPSNIDPSNCQALCLNCHQHKTERERNSKGR